MKPQRKHAPVADAVVAEATDGQAPDHRPHVGDYGRRASRAADTAPNTSAPDEHAPDKPSGRKGVRISGPLSGCTAKDLIKLLERASPSGQYVGQTFIDWIRLCSLARRRAERARQMPAEIARCKDLGDERDYQRYLKPYDGERADLLAQALALCIRAAEDGDAVIGDVYEEIGQSKGMAQMFGQYFTPRHVADMMALMIGAPEIGGRVSERLDAACELAGVGRHGRSDEALWCEEGARLKPHLVPVSVIDPSCGAGSLLHAFAIQLPHWMRASGMVWFYGIDLDQTCAQMCALQLWLDGCAYRVYHGDGLGTRLVSTVVLHPNEPIPTLNTQMLAQFDIALANPPFGKQSGAMRQMEAVLV